MTINLFKSQLWIGLMTLCLYACINRSMDQEEISGSNMVAHITSFDEVNKFLKVDDFMSTSSLNIDHIINIRPKEKYQSMDGFGYTLTGGSAQLLMKMSVQARHELLLELFGASEGQIGVSYLRVSIGASDLDEKTFSYDDIPMGSEDVKLEKFTMEEDDIDLIPILKDILAINPTLKIMASPWSPPVWMKSNGQTKGGTLLVKYYDVYARYFVKYIREMSKRGVMIDAVTVQNEPLHPGNNPSLYMTPEDQLIFVSQHLGPLFSAEGIATKIVLYDHNADRMDYPMTILDDSLARKYIDGSAFHLYGGSIEGLSALHDAHPDKNIYFTEQWIGAPGDFALDVNWHIKNLIIGGSRNWCKTILEWNLAADANQMPHTVGGCTRCLGALTIEGDEIIRNPAYYIIAHASKFVRPGSKRVFSTDLDALPNVAFVTPEGKVVLIVLNETDKSQRIEIKTQGRSIYTELIAEGVATYVLGKI
ncbi:MAG: glucosylceramidase [Reichenbachiella sp.]